VSEKRRIDDFENAVEISDRAETFSMKKRKKRENENLSGYSSVIFYYGILA